MTPYQINQLLQGRGHELVLGPYLILERLGEGGAGQVFKARHQKMNRVVALKVIRRELLADAEVVGRFYREIQVVSQLDHPNVVHAYDAGPVGATHFLAMEYVEGTDLGRLVKQSGPLPVLQACEYIRQAALGLQHAHERGLVHRDIKPHNLIMSLSDGLIKVADLGLARLSRTANEDLTAALTSANSAGSLTPQNAVMMGTADYLAPEQALDFHKADIRADIYGLGCTFYYLLTGRPPFAGTTLAEKLIKHQQAEPPPIDKLASQVPQALVPVIRRMLAKKPEERYQTPAEVAAALAAVLNVAGLPSASTAATWSSNSEPTQVLHVASLSSGAGGRPGLATLKRRLPFMAGAVLLLGLVGLTLLWTGKGRTPTGNSMSSEGAAQAAAKRFALHLEDGQLTTNQLPKELSALCDKHPGIEEPLRQELLAARLRCLGKPQALHVGEALMRLPSPLDRLHQGKKNEWLAVGKNEWLAVLDQEGPEASDRLKKLANENPFGLDFSPDCKILAVTGTNNTVRLWNLDGPKPMKGPLLSGHTDWVHAVAFSPDGTKVATGSKDKTVRLWDPATGKELDLPLVTGGDVQALAFTSDGKTLASGGNADFRLWDLTQSKPQSAKIPAGPLVGSLTFAPNKQTIAIGGGYGIGFWDPEKYPPVWLTGIDFLKEKATGRTHPNSLTYSPDGKILWVGLRVGGSAAWDMTGKDPKILWRQLPPPSAFVRGAFTPNGKTVVSAYVEGALMVTEVGPTDSKGNPKTQSVQLPPGLGTVHSFALAADGRHVALGNNKRMVYILRLAPPPGR